MATVKQAVAEMVNPGLQPWLHSARRDDRGRLLKLKVYFSFIVLSNSRCLKLFLRSCLSALHVTGGTFGLLCFSVSQTSLGVLSLGLLMCCVSNTNVIIILH